MRALALGCFRRRAGNPGQNTHSLVRELPLGRDNEKFLVDSRAQWKRPETIALARRGQHRRGQRRGARTVRRHLAHGRRIVEFGTNVGTDSFVRPPTIEFTAERRFASRHKDRESIESGTRTESFRQCRRGNERDTEPSRTAAEECCFQRGRRRLIGHDKIDLVRHERRIKFPGQPLPHHDTQIRSFVAGADDDGRDEQLRHGIADPEVHRLRSDGRAPPHHLDHFITQIEHALRVAPHDPARVGRDELAPLAEEKRRRQEFLQLAHLRTESRRGNTESPGRRRDSALRRHGEKVAEVVVIELEMYSVFPHVVYVYS